MKKYIFFLCMTASTAVFSQSSLSVFPVEKSWLEKEAEIMDPGTRLQVNDPSEIADKSALFLKTNISDLHRENSSVSLKSNIRSPYAQYLDFVQTFSDFEIYGTHINLAL